MRLVFLFVLLTFKITAQVAPFEYGMVNGGPGGASVTTGFTPLLYSSDGDDMVFTVRFTYLLEHQEYLMFLTIDSDKWFTLNEGDILRISTADGQNLYLESMNTEPKKYSASAMFRITFEQMGSLSTTPMTGFRMSLSPRPVEFKDPNPQQERHFRRLMEFIKEFYVFSRTGVKP